MPYSPIILASLAVSAVPNIEVSGVYALAGNVESNFIAAVARSSAGELLIKAPLNDIAASKQAAQNLALAAFTPGIRQQLNFEVPQVLGITRWQDYPAVVSRFFSGAHFNLADLRPDSELLEEISLAIHELHSIPQSPLQSSGLPLRNSVESRAQVLRLVDRAWQTKKLPVAVKKRWDRALGKAELWDFVPTVVHGSLSDESFLIEGQKIVAMLGFEQLAIDDPATDFAWLAAANQDVLEKAVGLVYKDSFTANSLIERAYFYHELELAKWLLHGVDTHNQAVIADAEELLDNLTEMETNNPGQFSEQVTSLNTVDVNGLLDETNKIVYIHSDLNSTESLSSLDEDRVFQADKDFSESDSDSADTRSETKG